MLIYKILFLLFFINQLFAKDYLLYVEGQGILGYSWNPDNDEYIYRSGMPEDDMQLNSLGFDYTQKIRGENGGDIGTGALQMRVAYNQYEREYKLQVYNAYLKFKTNPDIWVGHNRIGYGLASYWDTHSSLIQPLNMYGVGFDRDWGVGIIKDFENGDFKANITRGTGINYETEGSYLLTSRVSSGVLNYDNYNIGLSIMYGRIFEHNELKRTIMGGYDIAYNYNNIENKVEFDIGQQTEYDNSGHMMMKKELVQKNIVAGLYNLAFNFLEENRFKLEFQYVFLKKDGHNNNVFSVGTTFHQNAELSGRTMFEYNHDTNEKKVVWQVYWYYGV